MIRPAPPPHLAAWRRLRGTGRRPLLRARWRDIVFLHAPVAAQALQPHVPFPLDIADGSAWISLVCFTQVGLRLRDGGLLGVPLLLPIATHGFCNLRTYVRVAGEPGIAFIHEWIPNRLAAWIGPRTYGLPYRRAHLSFAHAPATGSFTGHVAEPGGGELSYALRSRPSYQAAVDPLDRFLIERYTAWCPHRDGVRFRIWHRPWRVAAAEVLACSDTLPRSRCPWWPRTPRWIAHVGPGADDVQIGGPMSGTEARR